MCTHRGGLIQATTSAPAAQMSLREAIAAAQRGERPTPSEDTMTDQQRNEAYREIRKLIYGHRTAQSFDENGSGWEKLSNTSWRFDADRALPDGVLRTGVGAMVRTTVDARGKLAYEVKSWTGRSEGPWRTFPTVTAADDEARKEMAYRLDQHKKGIVLPQNRWKY